MTKRPAQPSFEELLDASEKFYEQLNREDDVACVITSVAFVDQCVASLLEQFFIEGETSKSLLQPSGPIGSFVHRANLAYCIGLISDGFVKNLRTLAEIRNQFAHKHLMLSFTDEKVADLCAKLSFPRVRMRTIDPKTGKFRDTDKGNVLNIAQIVWAVPAW